MMYFLFGTIVESFNLTFQNALKPVCGIRNYLKEEQ
jgi:hypothetical protein